MNAKKLHKHALPVIAAAMAFLAISAVSAASLAAANRPSHNILANGLTTHAITVQVSTNGLASISPVHQSIGADYLPGSDDLASAALLYTALSPAK